MTNRLLAAAVVVLSFELDPTVGNIYPHLVSSCISPLFLSFQLYIIIAISVYSVDLRLRLRLIELDFEIT